MSIDSASNDNHNNDDIKKALFKLAHFNPTYKDEYGNQIIDYLVLDALSNYEPLLRVEPFDLKRIIKNQFKLDFEESEIVNCAKRLGSKGIIEYKEAEKRFDCPDTIIIQLLNKK